MALRDAHDADDACAGPAVALRLRLIDGFQASEFVLRSIMEADIHKLLGANVLRVLRGAEEVARRLKASTPAEVDEIKAERRAY
jgi:hypothetical protein